MRLGRAALREPPPRAPSSRQDSCLRARDLWSIHNGGFRMGGRLGLERGRPAPSPAASTTGRLQRSSLLRAVTVCLYTSTPPLPSLPFLVLVTQMAFFSGNILAVFGCLLSGFASPARLAFIPTACPLASTQRKPSKCDTSSASSTLKSNTLETEKGFSYVSTIRLFNIYFTRFARMILRV